VDAEPASALTLAVARAAGLRAAVASAGAEDATGLADSTAPLATGALASPTTVIVPSISGWMAQK